MAGNAVVSCSFSTEGHPAAPKILSGPDWNRTKPGFVPYDIQIGRLPHMLGPQHYLFFDERVGRKGRRPWIFRNIRLYEDGSPDPGPLSFTLSKFSPRLAIRVSREIRDIRDGLAPGSGQGGRRRSCDPSSRAQNTVNYPLDYNITENTILAFDLDVIDENNAGRGNGIGLSPTRPLWTRKKTPPRYFHFQEGRASHDPRVGFQDPAIGAYSIRNTSPTRSTPIRL